MALSDQIAARIEANLGKPLDAVLDAWAEATKDTAPQNTGALAMSVHTERTSPTEGALVMRYYGKIVATSTGPYSDRPRAIRARARYAATVGRTPVHPNPFYQQAWESERVKAALADFGELVFQRD